MKKIIKRAGIALGLLLALIVVIVLTGYALGSSRLNRTYNIPKETVSIPTDGASLERGEHLAVILCTECHGEDLGGAAFFDDPAIGTVNASNLTTGEGGAAAEMSAAELAAAIRYAVDHDGRGLIVMPSDAFFYLSDGDLGALIAYLNSAPPVDKEWAEPKLTFQGRVLIGLGFFGTVSPAEVIDQNAPRPSVPSPGVTAEYGQYLARVVGCNICHGTDLSGGKPPDPAAPPAPNLTPGGHLAEWSQADFIHAMREGVEPNGEEIDTEFMNIEGISQMTDDELRALWLYLHYLPALEDAVEESE